LPPGAGTAVLNFLALCARRPLRYRGPFPTASLFDALTDCFHIVGEPAAALLTFTRGAETAAVTGHTCEPPVEFAPAPFERFFSAPGEVPFCTQLRAEVERVYVGGHWFGRDRRGARRLRADPSGWAAVVELAGALWADVARFDRNGQLLFGPSPLPRVTSPLMGTPLSAGVQSFLARFLLPRAPILMRRPLAVVLDSVAIRWGDAGADAAALATGGDEIIVHAELVARLEEPGALLLAIAEAVEPLAQRLAQRELERLVTVRALTYDGLQ
jgi:hypothetical protein